MRFGTTFSHQQALNLKQDPQQSFLRILALPLQRIRLCAYWSELQPTPNQWHIDVLRWYVQKAENAGKQVVLACGQKAPRWPEFYLPNWVTTPLKKQPEPVLSYLKKLVNSLKNFSCITAWQVENEPFDQSGPTHQVIDTSLFQLEIELIRSLDQRPIVSTVWGNTLLTRNSFMRVTSLVDAIGLDFYPITATNLPRPLPSHYYHWLPIPILRHIIAHAKKPVYIAELQAEPWEIDQKTYLSRTQRSMSQLLLNKNIAFAQSLGLTTIDFWGSEYWLYAKDTHGTDYSLAIPRSETLIKQSNF